MGREPGRMARTLLGFYDLDAAPQHGVSSDLATRLGAATGVPGFIDGSVFVRTDHGGVALQIRYEERDGFEAEPAIAALMGSANWRSRASEVGGYRSAARVTGAGHQGDASFFVIQRFALKREAPEQFLDVAGAYVQDYARPVSGFLDAEVFISVDGERAAIVMPWAHEAALLTLESEAGSMEAMQSLLRMTERHIFDSYQLVSYLRGSSRTET